VSLIIQCTLGAADFSTGANAEHIAQHNREATSIFQHLRRIIRCVADFAIHRNDSATLRGALLLSRSIAGHCWDDSPLQLRQLDQIGLASVRKLAHGGVRSIDELKVTELHRIESLLGRAPPFGRKIHDIVKSFPRPRVTLSMVGHPVNYVHISLDKYALTTE
jgi:ATP-dependent DNA helicase HFM1/MER3